MCIRDSYGGIRMCYKHSALKRVLTMGVGSPAYMAREVNSTTQYSENADVWSIGCIMYVCGMLQLYVPGASLQINDWSAEASFLLKRMLHELPDERIGCGDIVEDPWPVSYTHLRAHETVLDLVCRLLLEKKKQTHYINIHIYM
eukprot:TRINITY_DN53445_c0_g1_i2.p1 TRINITY_DN53445_c0_g1~~TRINITY_DN53445_c0_g1_i2.p1  ORF type:complete len:144 (+),score=29.02 TRINITY_DN53445_c0_g1_i2:82-513(+)